MSPLLHQNRIGHTSCLPLITIYMAPIRFCLPLRHPAEKIDPHPVFDQFMNNTIGRAFEREEVRQAAIPAYMGLIKQCDDQMGRLFDYLEQAVRWKIP